MTLRTPTAVPAFYPSSFEWHCLSSPRTDRCVSAPSIQNLGRDTSIFDSCFFPTFGELRRFSHPGGGSFMRGATLKPRPPPSSAPPGRSIFNLGGPPLLWAPTGLRCFFFNYLWVTFRV